MAIELHIDDTINMVEAQRIYDNLEKHGHQVIIVNKERNEEEIGRAYCPFCGSLVRWVNDEEVDGTITRYLKCDKCDADIKATCYKG